MTSFVELDEVSVYTEAELEALRHKWIESERARCDLGITAIEQWLRDHWSGYVRACWFDHIEGRRFYKEFANADFGLLRHAFHHDRILLDRILDRLKAGQENLDVIQWSLDWNLPMDRVLSILEAVDINSGRLSHWLDEPSL